MSCGTRQWPTHWDLSKGMLVWVCVFKQIPNCWMWTQRTCTDFPRFLGVRDGEPLSLALAQHYLRGVQFWPPQTLRRGVDLWTGNGWVRVISLGLCGPPSNRTPEGWFARCDSSVHCRPLAARGVLLLILQFLSFSICFFFVLTYLLKRIKYKVIDK